MAIRRSPGCGCCAGCEVVENEDLAYDLTAGEVYQLPGTVNDFNKIELTHLLPDGYFSHIDDWFDIGLYEYDPVQQQDVLIQNLRYQLMSLGQSYQYHATYVDDYLNNSLLPYPALDKWRGLGVRVDNEWHILQPDQYQAYAGVNDVCIVGTSAGTYERSITYVMTALANYNYKYVRSYDNEEISNNAIDTNRWKEQVCPGKKPIDYGFEKNRYVLFDGETSVSSKFFRYNKSSQDTDLTLISQDSFGFNQVSTNHTVSAGSITSSFSRTIPTDPYTFFLYNYELDSSNFIVSGASVITHPTTSVTGAGHFEVECDLAIVESGGSVDLRVFRTNGNSEAVDVDIFYNGATTTLSFAAGENYKTITVNSVSHSGLRSDISRHTDSVPAIPKDKYSLNHILIRKDSWEVGTDSLHWLAKSHSAAQDRYFWYKGAIPFEKDGSIWKGSVKVKVTSSKDVTLGFYGITKFRNDATCDPADENQKLCSVHSLCDTISDFSHYPIDFSDSGGTMYLPTSEKHVFIDGCETNHLFRDEGMNFLDAKYVYRKNERYDLYYRDLGEDPVYLILNYTPPSNSTPLNWTKNCDGVDTSYTTYTDYSNLPSGHVYFESSTVQDVNCSGYGGPSIATTHIPTLTGLPPVANMSPASIGDPEVVIMGKTTYCDDWSFLYGDRNYTYTDDGSSPFSEVVAKAEIYPNYGSLDQPPDDQTDTTYEIVVSSINFSATYKGAVFQWNGSSYDMIGQDRIYVLQSMPSGSVLTDQVYIDAITQPFWFFYDGSYYYIKPNSGSALTVEGPFGTPTDTVNSVSVTYEGKKKIQFALHYDGATSAGVNANGSIYDDGWFAGMPEYERAWLTKYVGVTDFDTTIAVTDASGTVTASPLPFIHTRQELDPIEECSLSICQDGALITDAIKVHPDTNQYGYWHVTMAPERNEVCDCSSEQWSSANTLTDRNDAFDVPSTANADCDWLDCVPSLNPVSFNFDYCTQPSDAKAVDSFFGIIEGDIIVPALTEGTFNYTSGDICDCPDLTAESASTAYYDFTNVPVWNGQLDRSDTVLGDTSSLIRSFDYTFIMPLIFNNGYMQLDRVLSEAYVDYDNLDSNGCKRTRYITHQDVCDYTDFPTVTLTESDLETPGDDSYNGYGWDYTKRELRFVSGYTIGTEQIVDWHDPDYQSKQLNDVCWKMRQFASATMSYVDVHPRYTSPQIKKFTTLWPK